VNEALLSVVTSQTGMGVGVGFSVGVGAGMEVGFAVGVGAGVVVPEAFFTVNLHVKLLLPRVAVIVAFPAETAMILVFLPDFVLTFTTEGSELVHVYFFEAFLIFSVYWSPTYIVFFDLLIFAFAAETRTVRTLITPESGSIIPEQERINVSTKTQILRRTLLFLIWKIPPGKLYSPCIKPMKSIS
jgi:hypothetical protein